MSNRPQVSVVIPVYNVAAYLRECVDSVLTQSLTDIEVLLVDDGSTDESPQVVAEYVGKDRRVRAFRKVNGGLSSARNHGLERITADFVVFLDSDDMLGREALATMYRACVEQGAEIAAVKFTKNRDGLDKTPAKGVEILTGDFRTLAKGNARAGYPTVAAWGKMYRADLFADLRFPEGQIYEDSAVYLHLLDQVKTVAFCDYVGVYYRHNEDSITTRGIEERNFDIFASNEAKLELCRTKHPDAFGYIARNILNDNDFVALACVGDTSPLAAKLFDQIIRQNRELSVTLPIRRQMYRSVRLYRAALKAARAVYVNDRIRNLFKAAMT